ncbi:hypothetical protein RM151_11430 [Pantoea agglomerans]|uniref:hypothetical protein n=1 Tax=Enterobacter agglomerans TaxID=549 RepID=UPI002897C3CF|nr:hypothetical protein [Pantoea agglomerans]WNK56708.1 hypothetical protein RM151_11430 [Pantoea agglomerans]
MISLIINLVSKLGNLLLNKIPSKSKDEVEADNKETANETNREEIKSGKGWRNFLGYVCAFIIAYNYILVPILDYFGIVLFSFPLSDIIRIIVLLLSGN